MKSNNEKFFKEMKKFVNADQEVGNEYSRYEYMLEVGEMMTKYNLSTDDLQEIVDTYPNDLDVNKFVKGQLDFELEEKKETDKVNIFLKNSGVSDISNFYIGLKKLGYKISLT